MLRMHRLQVDLLVVILLQVPFLMHQSMMCSLFLSKYVRTGNVVNACLIFSNACFCSDSRAQTLFCFVSLCSGSESSDKTGLNHFR